MSEKSKIFIRKAEFTDRKAIFSVVNDAYLEYVGSTGSGCLRTNRYQHLEDVDHELKGMMVAVIDGEIVGVLGSQKMEGDEVLLGPFAVKVGMQGKGIGSRLFRCAEGIFRNVMMGVISTRMDLIIMYEGWGYRVVREEPLEKFIDPKRLSRRDLKYIILKKTPYIQESRTLY